MNNRRTTRGAVLKEKTPPREEEKALRVMAQTCGRWFRKRKKRNRSIAHWEKGEVSASSKHTFIHKPYHVEGKRGGDRLRPQRGEEKEGEGRAAWIQGACAGRRQKGYYLFE